MLFLASLVLVIALVLPNEEAAGRDWEDGFLTMTWRVTSCLADEVMLPVDLEVEGLPAVGVERL